MSPGDGLDVSGVPEIDAAVQSITEGDNSAKSGRQKIAAGKYHEAISQLKSVENNNSGNVSEVARRLLNCVHQRGRKLIDGDPIPDSGEVEKICDELGGSTNQEYSQAPTYKDVRERIARGDRLRRADQYDAAIECYQAAKNVADRLPAGSSGKTLQTEIDLNLRKAREKRGPEVSDELKRIHTDIREQITKGDQFQQNNKYDAAIECYRGANETIDRQLAGAGGKTLQTEVDLNLRKVRKKRRRAVQQVAKLDSEIRQLDHDRLARHGFEIPYRRAAVDPETIDKPREAVYTPSLDPDVLDEITAYYRELGSFERQLASVATETGQPTELTKLLGRILEARQSNVQADPEGEQDVVNAARDVTDVYLPLVTKNDDDGISEFEARLREVQSDVDSDAHEIDSRNLVLQIAEIQTWADRRARRVDLQSRAAALRDRWSATAGEHLHLQVDVIKQLTASDSGERSLSAFESGLETADRIVSLASRVETVREEYQMPVVDRLPQTFGRYLLESEISGARLDRLESTLDVIDTALDAHRQHPSYPFDRVVEHVCAELDGDISDEVIDESSELVKDASEILDFLDRVDESHPSVRPDEWKGSIHTGLENVTPELVRPLATLVESMGETLWKRDHLFQFSWEAFEQLVGSAFESEGYDTRVTQATSDEGVDIWAHNQGDRVAIQVKQFDTSNRVGRPTLQKLASHIAKDDADRVIVVTSSTFTKTAREYVNNFGQQIRLVDGTELVQMLTEAGHPPPVAE